MKKGNEAGPDLSSASWKTLWIIWQMPGERNTPILRWLMTHARKWSLHLWNRVQVEYLSIRLLLSRKRKKINRNFSNKNLKAQRRLWSMKKQGRNPFNSRTSIIWVKKTKTPAFSPHFRYMKTRKMKTTTMMISLNPEIIWTKIDNKEVHQLSNYCRSKRVVSCQ